ncbi:hypothetical protein DFH29DRAFT_954720 [Suillus ampliporus]|nr:hypothetical protein DFH29DRAFT_954720 [Suillus ampliporus]
MFLLLAHILIPYLLGPPESSSALRALHQSSGYRIIWMPKMVSVASDATHTTLNASCRPVQSPDFANWLMRS